MATLTIEVSYPFHSHLIGRSGRNINRIMEDTGTRIHFPDRNRITSESKSNSVVIRGRPANLENARQRIRVALSTVNQMVSNHLMTFSIQGGYSGRIHRRLQH